MTADNNSAAKTQTPPVHHPCLTAAEICRWRQGGQFAPLLVRRLYSNLDTGCPTCWDAIDSAQEIPPGDVLPSDSLEIRMLWSLTIYPEKSRRPSHRKAIRQARTEPLGVLRLLVEEVLELASMHYPHLVLGHVSYLETLLGEDPPADPFARRIWYDIIADLESASAMAWAQTGEHACAQEAVSRAGLSCFLGLASAPPEQRRFDANINMLLARAGCGFLMRAEVAIWQADFEGALALFETEGEEPRRMEVLRDFACRLVEAGDTSEAHRRFLEAARLGDQHGADHPILHLSVLHNLYRLEWRMAEEGQEDPPAFALFYNLALLHHNLAGPLYPEWGHPSMAPQARAIGTLLVLEGTRWAASTGLRDGWQRLQQMEPRNSLHGLELIGLATVLGDAAFLAEHSQEVRGALAGSAKARGRLVGFHQELLALGKQVDEAARATVIEPWLEAVERMLP